jgi:hypothetical protein
MNQPKELISVLEQIVVKLSKSEEAVYSSLTPNEVIKNIQDQIDKIKINKEFDKSLLKVEFAPTSTIQEIAMANDWSEEYLKLADKFDQLIS